MRSYIFLKKIVLFCLYFLWWKYRKNPAGLIVLTYHKISDEPDLEDPLKVSVATFEKQMRYLKNHYEILSGEQLVEIINQNALFPNNSCLITFDDGWRDNYTNAFPILKKYWIPAVIFICTDYIDTNKIFWYEELADNLMNINVEITIDTIAAELNEWPDAIIKQLKKVLKSSPKNKRNQINIMVEALKRFDEQKIRRLMLVLQHLSIKQLIEDEQPQQVLSWKEVIELSRDNICFGSHTKTHCLLTQIQENQVMEELAESKNIIENKIGKKVNLLSYPNGFYNYAIMRQAKEAGYCASFTTIPGVNDYNAADKHFQLKRKHVQELSSAGLANKFSDFFFAIELSCLRSRVNYLFDKLAFFREQNKIHISPKTN